jgi:maltose O-acetyltransferase
MGVIVLPGGRIGRGSVIGAGSVITRNVPPDTVVAGVPFVVHRQRLPAEALP